MQDFIKETFLGRILGKRLLPAGEHRGVHHISPVWQLNLVFATLILLTIITVGVTFFDMGRLNVWIALIIALIKASLVTTFFMHLKHDRPFHVFLFYTCFSLVVLFLGFALLDSTTYQPIVVQETAKDML